MALNILTGSKLVVKRIASKETKNPRVPVDGDALVAEVRFRTPRARAEALRGFFFRLGFGSPLDASRASFRALRVRRK